MEMEVEVVDRVLESHPQLRAEMHDKAPRGCLAHVRTLKGMWEYFSMKSGGGVGVDRVYHFGWLPRVVESGGESQTEVVSRPRLLHDALL